MRIVGIEPILVDVPLREPVHGVHGVTEPYDLTLVEQPIPHRPLRKPRWPR